MNDNMMYRSLIQPPTLSPVKLARRDKILAACEALFAAQGFRGTTIEALSEAAGISKVTMYGYFRDKDAVFAAVAERLATRLQSAVIAELDREGPIAKRIAAALTAKHSIVFDLVRRSTFSAELFQTKDTHVAQLFEKLDADIIVQLAGVLSSNDLAAVKADDIARTLFAASNGIASYARDKMQMSDQINSIVAALIAGH